MRITTRGSLKWLPIALTAFQSVAYAQEYHGSGYHIDPGAEHGVRLHINPRWRECSFQLDAALTQEAWRQFTGEAGVVTYFRPLTGAESMGRGRFEVSLVQWKTGIDDSDAAWNDTFVHPDSSHWLFEGNGLAFPGLTARVGVTDRTDVGVYMTRSPGANYGFYGLQVQQNLAQDAEKKWNAAGRVSFVSMYGPEDLEFTVYGLDLVASRQFTVLSRVAISPYAVASTSLSRSHEKSAVANVADENVFGVIGTVGATAQFSMAKVAVEYGVSKVPSFSIKIGIGTGSN